jgi:hypothetical protein
LLALLGAHYILHVGRIRVKEIIEIRVEKKECSFAHGLFRL